MTAHAIATDRMIGMVLLRPGWERDYEGRPSVFPVGCSGVITHFERLADGGYNIVLRGLDRFRVVEEDHSRTYRRAVIEPLRELAICSDDHPAIRHQRSKLEAMLAMGQSRPWQDALEALTGQKQMDASAIIDYFAPLKKWLDEQNQGKPVGW